MSDVLKRIGARPGAYVLDLSAAPLIDSAGAETLRAFVEPMLARGAVVAMAGVAPGPRRTLEEHGLTPARVAFPADVEAGRAHVSAALARGADASGVVAT